MQAFRSSRISSSPLIFLLYWLLALGLLSACGSKDDNNNEAAPPPEQGTGTQQNIQLLNIHSNKGTCSKPNPDLCYVVITDDGDLQFLPEEIQGFNYAWGHRYQIRVRIDNVATPAPGAPTQTYTLVEVVSDRKVDPGTRFTIDVNNRFVRLLSGCAFDLTGELTFTGSSNQACDDLRLALNANQTVFAIFGFTEDPVRPITLLAVSGPQTSSSSWSQLTYRTKATGSSCETANRFRLNQVENGRFIYQPCSGNQIQGSLTPAEFQRLSSLIDDVAAADLASPPRCEPSIPEGTITLDLGLRSGTTYRVYARNSSSTGVCYRGDRTAVLALQSFVGELVSRYAAPPTPRPSPSPSASPTPTPRPTATATPRPTATATPRPTATATPRPTATATPRPTATATPRPTATATPRPTATPTPTPTATPRPSPSPSPTPIVMPSPSPSPSASPFVVDGTISTTEDFDLPDGSRLTLQLYGFDPTAPDDTAKLVSSASQTLAALPQPFSVVVPPDEESGVTGTDGRPAKQVEFYLVPWIDLNADDRICEGEFEDASDPLVFDEPLTDSLDLSLKKRTDASCIPLATPSAVPTPITLPASVAR